MQGKNKVISRYLYKDLIRLIKSKYSCLILGPRQVGKTTLVKQCLNSAAATMEYLLQDPSVRIELEANPSRIIHQVQAQKKHPCVFVDEAQKIPAIFDAAQVLIDNKDAYFILTGSSARKLKRHGVNLLPGRIKRFYLNPLSWGELGLIKGSSIKQIKTDNINKDLGYSFEDLLIYGSLPGIVMLPGKDRKDF